MTDTPRPPDPEDVEESTSNQVRNALRTIVGALCVAVFFLICAVVYLLVQVVGQQDHIKDQQTNINTQQQHINKLTMTLEHETQNVIAELRKHNQSQCEFNLVLGGIPLPADPFPSKRTVQVVAAARGAYRELGCPAGRLPKPGRVLKLASARYNINVDPR